MADEEKREESGDISDHKKSGDTKVSLSLRILVSVYVLYLAYGLICDFGKTVGSYRILIGAAIVIFVLAGGAILLHSAVKLFRKDYVDKDGD